MAVKRYGPADGRRKTSNLKAVRQVVHPGSSSPAPRNNPIERGDSEPKPKTLIGVLASHDDRKPNESLVSIFTHLYHRKERHRLERFHFVFTGGTYDRIFFGEQNLGVPALEGKVSNWLLARCGVTRLPSTHDGGVIVLSYLISQRECSIVWPFYAPNANHWQRHENLAFMRLSDQWHVKRLMNSGSVMVWFDHETDADANRNLQACPPKLVFSRLSEKAVPIPFPPAQPRPVFRGNLEMKALKPRSKPFANMTIALIAHDEMKGRMIDFAIDHEAELNKFGTILATGTTGREVTDATSVRIERKMMRYHSGPKGGDIEIATSILYGQCDVVLFFVDPLKPHPHIEDIRVVFQACMVREHVVMITNEMHAREFMSRVVRNNDFLDLYQ
jgi:methylglyoxal synthase